MKALATLAFGTIALLGANFATAAPAAASNVGVYAGSNGFAIQVSDYGGHYGYRHYRGRGCGNYWYRRNHPYRCGYGYGHHYPRYNNYYYHNDYRPHRRHWRHRHHRRHHDNWRDRW